MTAVEVVRRVRISQVWHMLGGGEIRRHHSQAFWRNGDGLNVALNDDEGIWFDYRDNVGGGILDLIAHVQGGSRSRALKWLADRLCLPLNGPKLSPDERKRYAKAQKQAPVLARAATLWHAERLAELDELKRAALERNDIPALAAAASEHHLLSILAPEGIARAYIDARRKWPKHTRALVRDGERWAQWSEVAVATLIGQWHADLGDTDISGWEMDGGATRWLAPWPSDFTA
jgi:hypothetical protein